MSDSETKLKKAWEDYHREKAWRKELAHELEAAEAALRECEKDRLAWMVRAGVMAPDDDDRCARVGCKNDRRGDSAFCWAHDSFMKP